MVGEGYLLRTAEDGKVGYVLSPEKDLQNVFNNGGPKGAGQTAVIDAIVNGAETLDCFNGHLPRLYAKLGFKAYKALAWDDQYAPPGWDYETLGRPDVIFMRYDGGTRDPEEISARYGTFGDFTHPGYGGSDTGGGGVDEGGHKSLTLGVATGQGGRVDVSQPTHVVGLAGRGHQLLAAFAFKEEEHPRKRAGKEGAGQFARKDEPGRMHTVGHGNLKSKYSVHVDKRIPGSKIPLKNYKQCDYHSCGFVAALTVAQYLVPGTRAKTVLKVVRPGKSYGIDGEGMVEALKKLDVEATFRDDLSVPKLRAYVEKGIPVVLTVYPEDWSSDHWVVVQGFDEDRIYLTNYKSLSIAQFRKEWFEPGDGLVCEAFPDVEEDVPEDTFEEDDDEDDDTDFE